MTTEETVYRRLLTQASRAARHAQFVLDTEYFVKATIDEVSILFKHATEMAHFVRYASGAGWNHFNTAEDTVQAVRDFNTMTEADVPPVLPPIYTVQYKFLQMPGFQWRLECMCIMSGDAPVHRMLKNHEIAHVSFKCIDHAHYDHMKAVLAGVTTGPRTTLQMVDEFTSGYGRFAYFGGYPPYVKPRVNLRDAVQRG